MILRSGVEMIAIFDQICYNLTLIIDHAWHIGVDIMQKLHSDEKIWLEKQIRRELDRRTKENHRKKRRRAKGKKYTQTSNNRRSVATHSYRTFCFTAPKVFSIVANSEETLLFYRKILDKRQEHHFDTTFIIDVGGVEEVSADALMYLIAIVNDTKFNGIYRYKFQGNFPSNQKAKQFFIDSGFVNFVHSIGQNQICPQSDNIQILQGNFIDTETAKNVCGYVQKICKVTRKDTIPLYEILIELMGNTTHHAYNSTLQIHILPNLWYMFAQEKDNRIDIVFLDTGYGIPTTVRKNWIEKMSVRLLQINQDSYFIRSALKGEFRSQTRDPSRGKGLPQISECFHSGLVKDVFVCSGKGVCILNKSLQDDYQISENRERLEGTLFCWQIAKIDGEETYDKN